MTEAIARTIPEKWYSDWQDEEHARHFDQRVALNNRRLTLHFDSFNDVHLLNERLDRSREISLLEVGSATGEFYRYLRSRYPKLRYTGIDLSQPAVLRAQEKYPEGRFHVSDPRKSLWENLEGIGVAGRPEVLYSKDVLHHQTDPFGFLSELLAVPSEILILRTRTRDRGETVLDPECSCQYHYNGWMPYLVLNLKELIGQIQGQVPEGELVVYRNHIVLGGWQKRFLPKECYLPETGTAETAIGVFLKTQRPGVVSLQDRKDLNLVYPLWDRIADRLTRFL